MEQPFEFDDRTSSRATALAVIAVVALFVLLFGGLAIHIGCAEPASHICTLLQGK